MNEPRRSRRRRGPFPSLLAFFERTGELQTDVAADLGISDTHMSNLVAGRRFPSYRLALRLSERTNVPVDALHTQPVEAA